MHSVWRKLLQLGPGARCCVSTEFAVMLLRCWQQTSYLNRFAQIQACFEASSQRGQLVILQTWALSVSPLAKAQPDQRSKLRSNEKHYNPEKNWTRKHESSKFDVRFTPTGSYGVSLDIKSAWVHCLCRVYVLEVMNYAWKAVIHGLWFAAYDSFRMICELWIWIAEYVYVHDRRTMAYSWWV